MAVEDKHPNRTFGKDASSGHDAIVKSYEEDAENGMTIPWFSITPIAATGKHQGVKYREAPKESDEPGAVISQNTPLTVLRKWLGPSLLPTTAAIHPVKGNLLDPDETGHIPGLGDKSAVAVKEVPRTASKAAGKMTMAKEKLAWETRARQEVQQYGDDLVARQTVASKFHKPDETSAAESGVQPEERIRKAPSMTARAPKP